DRRVITGSFVFRDFHSPVALGLLVARTPRRRAPPPPLLLLLLLLLFLLELHRLGSNTASESRRLALPAPTLRRRQKGLAPPLLPQLATARTGPVAARHRPPRRFEAVQVPTSVTVVAQQQHRFVLTRAAFYALHRLQLRLCHRVANSALLLSQTRTFF